MNEEHYRQQMDIMMDATKDALIDAFAEFVGLLNDRNLEEAALCAHSLAYGLGLFSQGLATEALARRMSGGLDKPE